MRALGATLLAGIFLPAALATAASAATLEPMQGHVYFNLGKGFKPATSAVTLAPGSKILIAPSGSASLQYDGDCTVRLSPGRVWTVAAKKPCVAGQNEIDFSNRMSQGTPPPPPGGALPPGGAPAGFGNHPRPPAGPTVGSPPLTVPPPAPAAAAAATTAATTTTIAVVAGTVVVGGIVVATTVAKDDDEPTSP